VSGTTREWNLYAPQMMMHVPEWIGKEAAE